MEKRKQKMNYSVMQCVTVRLSYPAQFHKARVAFMNKEGNGIERVVGMAVLFLPYLGKIKVSNKNPVGF